MIVLVGGEKGGTGKSLIATTLAAMRARRGHDVLLLDADPQQSATAWAGERPPDAARVICMSRYGPRFVEDVRELAGRFGDVVIDAGGRDSRELRGGLVLADWLYTPLQPSQADAWTLDRMEELVGQAQALNARLRAYAVLSRAYTNPHVPETQDAIRLLGEFELIQFSGVTLCERLAYRRAFGLGLSAEEMPTVDAKARDETLTLYQHAYEQEA